MENQENSQVVEEVTTESQQPAEQQPAPKKKSLKWLWITIAAVLIAGVVGWFVYNCVGAESVNSVYSIATLLAGIFIVTALGYLLGRVTIKGVSLGTAGVFIVAIAFGLACSFIPSDWAILGAFRLEPGVGNTKFYKRLSYK